MHISCVCLFNVIFWAWSILCQHKRMVDVIKKISPTTKMYNSFSVVETCCMAFWNSLLSWNLNQYPYDVLIVSFIVLTITLTILLLGLFSVGVNMQSQFYPCLTHTNAELMNQSMGSFEVKGSLLLRAKATATTNQSRHSSSHHNGHHTAKTELYKVPKSVCKGDQILAYSTSSVKACLSMAVWLKHTTHVRPWL